MTVNNFTVSFKTTSVAILTIERQSGIYVFAWLILSLIYVMVSMYLWTP